VFRCLAILLSDGSQRSTAVYECIICSTRKLLVCLTGCPNEVLLIEASQYHYSCFSIGNDGLRGRPGPNLSVVHGLSLFCIRIMGRTPEKRGIGTDSMETKQFAYRLLTQTNADSNVAYSHIERLVNLGNQTPGTARAVARSTMQKKAGLLPVCSVPNPH